MKNHHKIKLIAASVALMTSFGAMAGLGGLNVHSHLGEPFSGTISVTGDEAKALLNGGKASISNGTLRAGIRKSGGDGVVLNIRSSKPIQDPVLIFQVGVGSQSREYTAIIDPAGYSSKSDGANRVQNTASQINRVGAAPANTAVDRQAARERINRVVNDDNAARKETLARRPANDAKQTKTAKPKIQENKEYSGIVYGKRHLVRHGETLTGIASRIRPQNMTLEQTVQSLVNANPDVFIGHDANRMLAGKVLNIPNRSELGGYADKAAPAVKPAETPMTKPDTSPAEPANKAASAEKTPAGTNAAAPAEQAASQAAASVSVAVPSEAHASDTAAAASDVAASAEALKPTVPAATKPVVQDVESESEDSGLWRWLLLGGAGLLALFFLSKSLGKRKTEVAETASVAQSDEAVEAEEDFSEFKTVPETEQAFAPRVAKEAAAVTGVAVAAAVHVAKKADDELEVEDDFGDDIFFTEIEEPSAAKQNSVDLDLNALDNAQGAIVSGAVTHDEETEKRRDADWDAIESTESVYEPELENPYISHAVQEPAAADDAVAPSVESFAVASQSEARESWDFEPEAVKEEAEKPETQEVQKEEWDFFSQESQPEAVVESEENTGKWSSETGTEESALEWDIEESQPETVIGKTSEEVAKVPAEPVPAEEGIEFELSQADLDEPLEFVAPQVEEHSVETAETVENDAFTPAVADAEISAEPELFEIQRAESLSFQDEEDLNAEVAQVAEADETIEWNDIAVSDTADSSRREAGFISESVGMTAPLEAKYELAKMYVEIGDPDAARETLQELLEESDGAILGKVKAMLEELDA